MKLFKYLTFSILSLLFLGCGGANSSIKTFDLVLNPKQKTYKKGDKISYSIKNPTGKTITGISFSIDGFPLIHDSDSLELDSDTLGNKTLEFDIEYEDTHFRDAKKIKLMASEPPKIYTYTIVNTFPHDRHAYTQGLEFYNGVLYESTGLKGESSLRKVDYKTGEVLNKVDLPASVFGEGITILNDKIYMLTWQSSYGYVFDLDFNELDRFNYGVSKEGWGLCNDGEKIFKSDGTEKMWILNPSTLQEEVQLETVTDKSFFNKTNELEYVDGLIYANVYLKESMMIIDAHSGAIKGVINFSGLKEHITKHPDTDVLNGVAYHPERKTFFITGKKWDKMFEVEIVEKK